MANNIEMNKYNLELLQRTNCKDVHNQIYFKCKKQESNAASYETSSEWNKSVPIGLKVLDS